MNEYIFDGMRSKLVPDEKFISCFIDRINEKSNTKPKYSIGWVKCAAFALVLAIIISVLPFALKNNNSNNPIVPPQTEAGESTEPGKHTIGSAGIVNPVYGSIAGTYSMVKIIEYTDQVIPHSYEHSVGRDRIPGIVAKAEVIVAGSGNSKYKIEKDETVVKMVVPYYLYEENYLDYVVSRVSNVNIEGTIYYKVPADEKVEGIGFADGKVDFSNILFCGEDEDGISRMNEEVRWNELFPSNDIVSELYPDFCIEDGLSAEKVKEFLERTGKAATESRKIRAEQQKKNRENGVIVSG